MTHSKNERMNESEKTGSICICICLLGKRKVAAKCTPQEHSAHPTDASETICFALNTADCQLLGHTEIPSVTAPAARQSNMSPSALCNVSNPALADGSYRRDTSKIYHQQLSGCQIPFEAVLAHTLRKNECACLRCSPEDCGLEREPSGIL